ncbi:MAG: hypothetical protein K9H64_10750 [Bacteroidales bacterium]|nr:hypothetical protein [Bacteroidales bacterium]MCF8456423.1 hypothetical protein [Bacteroidales bacterium]
MKLEKQCVVCGNPFFAANNKGTYCSGACRSVAWRKRNLKYAWQEEDLTRLEELQEDYISLQSSHKYAMQKCKEYEIKIGQLQAERKVLNELNMRLMQ